MPHLVLARKWRPRNFQEILGQQHITESLINSLKSKKIAHAYLFSGPHGVGKTTAARVLAASLRCEKLEENSEKIPCGDCKECNEIFNENSLDVIEIDGASYNGVQNIREILENVQYRPSCGHYRIYIIDEVHMLSKEAFNALLKTLESPPPHIIFIFATTDPDKILLTVLSRLQRYDFKMISEQDIQNQLLMIAKKENINFLEDSLTSIIAKHAKGHLRDALVALDQVLGQLSSLTQPITKEHIYLALGLVEEKVIEALIEAIINGKTLFVSKIMHDLEERQVNLLNFLQSTLNRIFVLIQDRLKGKDGYEQFSKLDSLDEAELFWIFEGLSKDLKWAYESFTPALSIELVLQKYALRRTFFQKDATSKNKVSVPKVEVQLKEEVEKFEEPIKVEKKQEELKPRWDDFLQILRDHSKTLLLNLEQGNLLSFEFNKNNGEIQLEIAFPPGQGVFSKYLNRVDARTKLLELLSNFYQLPNEKIHLQINDLDEIRVKETSFRSIVKIREDEYLSKEENRKQQFLEDQFVQQAQKLFNRPVEQVEIVS